MYNICFLTTSKKKYVYLKPNNKLISIYIMSAHESYQILASFNKFIVTQNSEEDFYFPKHQI